MRPRLPSWQLFAAAVLIWGTTWHAIVHQLAQATPELGVATRFGVAGALVLAWAAWRGERLRFSWRQHALLALQGTFMFSVSYLCVYHAERHVPSGLVAVGYSASPLVMGVAGRLLWGSPLTPRFVLGGTLCVAGVALIFTPEFARVSGDSRSALGAAFTVGAVLLSAVGSLVASRNRIGGIPFWPALGYGMLYGAVVSALFVVADGQPLRWPTGPQALGWWLWLLYLSVFGSVVAFACYLLLQQRLGVGPAATVGVTTPVIALAISTAFEGYQPGWPAWTGVALAIAGNALALGLGSRRRE